MGADLIIGGVLKLIDKVIPDPQAAADAKLKILEMQKSGDLAELQGAIAIIVAEASGNWLQKSWRPLLMLFFAGLIGARWFGWSADGIGEAEYLELWDIVKLGLGGYVIGRSAEKIAPSIAAALKRGN